MRCPALGRLLVLSCTSLALAVAAAPAARADDNPHLDPHDAKPGTTAQWQAADGLKFEYHVPADYDPARGANLTLVLHGNGLDHRWTFWNHPPDEFRRGDLVVSPDGTTFAKGTGANEFLGETADADRVHALLEELKALWKVRQTFLYGHSQGSFFVFYYAGAHPEDVAGVAGHASGAWNWTTMGSKSRHVAIGLMHGTQDGNVPYGQSWWTRKVYVETAKYPLVHLRTLFDWDHRPHWRQAELVLAWCEGMTSEDPARIATSLDTLAADKVPLGRDWGALWAVADRLAHDKRATEAQRARGAALAEQVHALGLRHVAAIEAATGTARKGVASSKDAASGKGVATLRKLGDGMVAGHLIRFLEEFQGVPALEAWVAKHKAVFKSLAEAGEEHYGEYVAEREQASGKAIKAGLALLENGYTHYETKAVLKQLDRWVEQGTAEASDRDRERLAELGDLYRVARKDGFAAYDALNAEVGPLAAP
jgi:pimeloyl-ACP methyl ester carboxylesterase